MVKMLLFIRSLFFNVFFAIESVVISIFGYGFYLIDKKYMRNVGKIWAKTTLFGLKYICDLSYKIEGKIPEKSVIFASKHQSALECLIFWAELDYPKFILKQELTKVPFVGLYFKLMDMIIIDRSSVRDAMIKLPIAVKKSIVDDNRSVILFPEGTRTKHGEQTKSKGAINFIQKNNDFTEICPVVLDTGKFWGKNSFIKKPGITTIKFLPTISCNESYKTINDVLDNVLDEGSDHSEESNFHSNQSEMTT